MEKSTVVSENVSPGQHATYVFVWCVRAVLLCPPRVCVSRYAVAVIALVFAYYRFRRPFSRAEDHLDTLRRLNKTRTKKSLKSTD